MCYDIVGSLVKTYLFWILKGESPTILIFQLNFYFEKFNIKHIVLGKHLAMSISPPIVPRLLRVMCTGLK